MSYFYLSKLSGRQVFILKLRTGRYVLFKYVLRTREVPGGVGMTPVCPRSIVLDSKVGLEEGEVGWLFLKMASGADLKVKNRWRV